MAVLDAPVTHSQSTVNLAPGDLVLLYTDGITEAMSTRGDWFGESRLDQVLRDVPEPATPDTVVERCEHAIACFTGGKAPADDQTLLALSKT